MAITSDEAICNIALRKLREQPIASLLEESEPARLCATLFEPARDALLMRHPSNFSMTRQQLTQQATAPLFEWDYEYLLPTSPFCLRAYALWHNGAYRKSGWQVENRAGQRVIVSNWDDDVYLLYIARITDASMFSASFVEALSDYLALQLAFPLTRDKAQTEQREAIFKLSWREHKNADAGEGFPLEPDDGAFVSIRG